MGNDTFVNQTRWVYRLPTGKCLVFRADGSEIVSERMGRFVLTLPPVFSEASLSPSWSLHDHAQFVISQSGRSWLQRLVGGMVDAASSLSAKLLLREAEDQKLVMRLAGESANAIPARTLQVCSLSRIAESGRKANDFLLQTAGGLVLFCPEISPVNQEFVPQRCHEISTEMLGLTPIQLLPRQVSAHSEWDETERWQRWRATSQTLCCAFKAVSNNPADEGTCLIPLAPWPQQIAMFALDNSRLLPPFLCGSSVSSYFRITLFFELLSLMYPHSVCLVSPIEDQLTNSWDIDPVSGLHSCLLLHLLRSWRIPVAIQSPGQRLRLVATYLSAYENASNRQLHQLLLDSQLSLEDPVTTDLDEQTASYIREEIRAYRTLLESWPEQWNAHQQSTAGISA